MSGRAVSAEAIGATVMDSLHGRIRLSERAGAVSYEM